MPYRLNKKGFNLIHPLTVEEEVKLHQLTNQQIQALDYLNTFFDKDHLIGAREVALYYGYPNGQYFRGVLASLHKKGLLDKEGE